MGKIITADGRVLDHSDLHVASRAGVREEGAGRGPGLMAVSLF